MRHDYIYTEAGNPHLLRMRQMLAKYPQLRDLFGYYPLTAFYTFLIVFLQILLGAWLENKSFVWILILSYLVGATANHALYVIIHECTHNLVFKKSLWNRLLGIFANFPQVFPSYIQFAKYHTLHHTHQSEYDFDADLASYDEARWIGNSPWRKALSLAFFGFVQGVMRPQRLKKVNFWDGWFFFNILIQTSFMIFYFYFTGWNAVLYLLLSTFFALGLHPLGARWIQEHYVMKEGQETYSYYGPLNKVCFNMGYHNEHHDFIRVPWARLPQLRKIAPEFYDSLYSHKSWTHLLYRFIFDPNLSFFSRIVRPSRKVMQNEELFDTAVTQTEPISP